MQTAPRIDRATMIGFGALLMPLLTMWHEIGGHAAMCVAQGGHVATIGAFYVQCERLSAMPAVLVACAGVAVNIVLAVVAYALWSRARSDVGRLTWWLIWVSEGFVAAGYPLFSGVTGFGDLGIGRGGALSHIGLGWPVRLAEVVVGLASYIALVRAAIATLAGMIGTGPETRTARRTIAHTYYLTSGAGALFVGLLNPLGLVITIMSAIAATFGGLAGFITVGFATKPEGTPRPFVIPRRMPVIAGGGLTLIAFALVLGRSIHFP